MAERRIRQRRWSRWVWITLAVLLLLLVFLLLRVRARPVVMLVHVTVGKVVSAVYAPGTVTSSTQTTVTASVAGRVIARYVELGTPVAVGQAVAQLDDTQARYQLDQARQEQASAEAQRGQAQANVLTAQARVQSAREAVIVQQEQARAVQARVGVAVAQVQAARANLASAQDAYSRQQYLYAHGAIAQRQLVEARAAVQTAQAQLNQMMAGANAARQDAAQAVAGVEAARASVSEAQSGVTGAQAALASAGTGVQGARVRVAAAQDVVSRSTVRSLVRGIVSETPVAVGDFVQVGMPVVRVVSPALLYVRADVDETDISPVALGQRAYFTSDANPGMTYQGIVSRVGASASTTTNTYPVDITRLSTPTGLRVNMSVDVNIVTRTNPRGLLLPATAVVEEPAPHVWQVDARNRLIETPVTVGARDQTTGQVEILRGLQAGDAVVANPQTTFQPGQVVRAR